MFSFESFRVLDPMRRVSLLPACERMVADATRNCNTCMYMMWSVGARGSSRLFGSLAFRHP
jgi:hypothetical protein